MIRDDEGLGKTKTAVVVPPGALVKTGPGRVLAVETTWINDTGKWVQLFDNVVSGSAADKLFTAVCKTDGVEQFVMTARPQCDFTVGLYCAIGEAGAVERVTITYR